MLLGITTNQITHWAYIQLSTQKTNWVLASFLCWWALASMHCAAEHGPKQALEAGHWVILGSGVSLSHSWTARAGQAVIPDLVLPQPIPLPFLRHRTTPTTHHGDLTLSCPWSPLTPAVSYHQCHPPSPHAARQPSRCRGMPATGCRSFCPTQEHIGPCKLSSPRQCSSPCEAAWGSFLSPTLHKTRSCTSAVTTEGWLSEEATCNLLSCRRCSWTCLGIF